MRGGGAEVVDQEFKGSFAGGRFGRVGSDGDEHERRQQEEKREERESPECHAVFPEKDSWQLARRAPQQPHRYQRPSALSTSMLGLTLLGVQILRQDVI